MEILLFMYSLFNMVIVRFVKIVRVPSSCYLMVPNMTVETMKARRLECWFRLRISQFGMPLRRTLRI